MQNPAVGVSQKDTPVFFPEGRACRKAAHAFPKPAARVRSSVGGCPTAHAFSGFRRPHHAVARRKPRAWLYHTPYGGAA
ncbi:hypothetical protein [Kingella potus]|uniref:hypothetical protein n=1 Tax=Kingella potus TaxID=265175 RepID=UPI001FD0DDD7|nr:hypothetical protein [Kingella potus]UOP00800.1 hypothetical protein LVJ84_13785 [Kingella potus]